VAWHLKKNELKASHRTPVKAEYIYNISNSEYRKEWGHIYETPGFFARLKALVFRVLPKVGPLSSLKFRAPPPEVEQLYMGSFNTTLDRYRVLLVAQENARLQLPNDNLDLGAPTESATYKLADNTFAKLLDKTSGRQISDALRNELLSYYWDVQKPFATKRDPKAWARVMRELEALKLVHSASHVSSPGLCIFCDDIIRGDAKDWLRKQSSLLFAKQR
jgi:hypothetical protein